MNQPILYIDNVYSLIETDDYRLLSKIRNKFKIQNDIYLWRRNPALKWQYLISKKGRFYTGIVNKVYSYMKNNLKETPRIIDLRSFLDYDLDRENIKLRLKNLNVKLRDYQFEGLKIALKKPRGVFNYPTGSGKTVLMASIIAALNVPTLVVCGKKDLAKQLRDDLSFLLGESVGLIGAGEFKICDVTIGIVASLHNKNMSKTKQDRVNNFLESIRYLQIDEAHHLQAKTWKAVASKVEFAAYKHGFTASFMTSKIMKDAGKSQRDSIILQLHTGGIAHKIDILDLVEQGWLANPTIKYVEFNHRLPASQLEGVDYHESYKYHIVHNELRNVIGCDIIKSEYEAGNQTIVFCKAIKHGQILKDLLSEYYEIPVDDIDYMNGQIDQVERDRIVKDFRKGKTPIMIGTSVIGEGLNFFCDTAVNLSGGDSDIDTIQRFGRILRKPKTATGDVNRSVPSFVTYYEIFDKGHKWFTAHTRSRKKVYENLGFDIQPDYKHMEAEAL